jgi:hypothetical protein
MDLRRQTLRNEPVVGFRQDDEATDEPDAAMGDALMPCGPQLVQHVVVSIATPIRLLPHGGDRTGREPVRRAPGVKRFRRSRGMQKVVAQLAHKRRGLGRWGRDRLIAARVLGRRSARAVAAGRAISGRMDLRPRQADVAQQAVVELCQLLRPGPPARLAPHRIDHMVIDEARGTSEESAQGPIVVHAPLRAHHLHLQNVSRRERPAPISTALSVQR